MDREVTTTDHTSTAFALDTVAHVCLIRWKPAPVARLANVRHLQALGALLVNPIQFAGIAMVHTLKMVGLKNGHSATTM